LGGNGRGLRYNSCIGLKEQEKPRNGPELLTAWQRFESCTFQIQVALSQDTGFFMSHVPYYIRDWAQNNLTWTLSRMWTVTLWMWCNWSHHHTP